MALINPTRELPMKKTLTRQIQSNTIKAPLEENLQVKQSIKMSIEKPILVDIQEDLALRAVERPELDAPSLAQPIALMSHIVQKELTLCAAQIGVESEELQAWLELHIEAPSKTILTLLRTATQYRLDPLREEVLANNYQGVWQVSISVDGWIKLINQNPTFTGLTFNQSSETDQGLPLWMECTIHRSDRPISTTAREYLAEVRYDSDIWKKMPRRMLRHRALQQCARLAFAINPPDGQIEKQQPEKSKQNPLEQQADAEVYPAMSAKDNLKGIAGLRVRLNG